MTGLAATLEATPRPPSRGAGVGFAASLALHAIVLAGVVWWRFDAGAHRAPQFVVEIAFLDAAPAADAVPASAPVAIAAPPAVEQTRIEPPPAESPPLEAIREAALPLPSPPRPRPTAALKAEALPQPALSPLSPSSLQLASAAPVSDAAEHAEVPAPASVGSPTSAPASPAVAAAPPGIAVLTTPRFRERPVPPTYPRRALDLGQEGEVVVRALVGPDGESREIRLWRSSGVAALDDAALRAVRRWAFEAARVDGRPVEAWVEVPVRFQLRSVL